MTSSEIIQLIAAGAIGIIGYLLTDLKSTIKDNVDEHEREIDEIRKEIADYRANAPHKYVMRDDFLRAISNLDAKMDNMGTEISQIHKSVSEMIGGGRVEKSG